jgi:hypothetical protein
MKFDNFTKVAGDQVLAADYNNIELLVLKSFTAGEDITAGQPVAVAKGNSSIAGAKQTATDANITLTTTNWNAQTFLTSKRVNAIVGGTIKIHGNGQVEARHIRVSIRATSANKPTGSDIGATAEFDTDDRGVKEYTFTFGTPVTVSPNTTYAIVVRRYSADAYNNPTIAENTGGYSDGNQCNSTDSGSTWTVTTGKDLYFTITERQGTAGRVYLTEATLDNEWANNFIGFAIETITSGNAIKIVVSGYDDNQTGLTVGSTYYLSDTPGAIATSAGSQSRKIGLAISATEILIKHDNA